MGIRVNASARLLLCCAGWMAVGCGAEETSDQQQDVTPNPQTGLPGMTDGMPNAQPSPAAGAPAAQPMPVPGAQPMQPMPGGEPAPGSEPAPGGAAGATAPDPTEMPMPGEPAAPGEQTPIGPEEGDPNAPVYENPDVACGGPTASFGRGSANFMLDGREMIVSYPCGKHEGAPMTFILNLHGTTPVELHFYQHGYFAIHEFIDSHNFIVVTPSSVVQQWGNGDNGEDEPHLMNIIDWVYTSFAPLDIRGMWVAGHSWGGLYTARFGCSDAIADKVKGLMLQSGGGIGGFGGASCGDRVSVLISTAEGDGRMPSDQSSLASSHGCDAAQNEVIANINDHTFWPNCDPGFVHANYYMREKEHATSMDSEVVESVADWIKLARQ